MEAQPMGQRVNHKEIRMEQKRKKVYRNLWDIVNIVFTMTCVATRKVENLKISDLSVHSNSLEKEQIK